MKPGAKIQWQIARLAILVKRNRLADFVHNQLTAKSAGHVLFELLADGCDRLDVHFFVQHLP